MGIEVRKLHTLSGHRDPIYTVLPAGDNRHFFSAGGDGFIVRWDLDNPQDGHLIARVPNSVYALALLPEGQLLAGQNFSGLHWLDWQGSKELRSLQLGSFAIFDIAVVGNVAWVACGDGQLRWVDLSGWRVLDLMPLSSDRLRSIAVHPEGHEVVVGGSDGKLRRFNSQGQLLQTWAAHDTSVFATRFSPDGQVLLSAGRDARLKSWCHAEASTSGDFHPGTTVVAHMFAINSLDFSENGKNFVSCSLDKSIKVWETSTLKLLKVIDRSRHAGHGTSVNKVIWNGTRNLVVSASDDRTLSIWEIIF